MASASYLSTGKVNLLELKEWLRREFLSFFETYNGKKLIVWDHQLTIPIGLISEYSVLKERGVDKMLDLQKSEFLRSKDIIDFSHVFFIVRPRIDLMEIISNHMLSIEKDSQSFTMKEFHIIFVPRKSLLCERKLQDLGVYGSFKNNLHEFALDLMPLDYDLLSMENSDVFKDCFLFNDNTHLFQIAKSIMTLQILYGIIPNIYGKGKCARVVVDMLLHMRKEIPPNQEPHIAPKIDNLIIIDRTIDNLTPMMTQLTYEGLIDENLGIKYTQLEVSQEMLKKINKSNSDEKKRMIVALNSSDSLFGEIRDKNFNAVSTVLSRTAKELQQAYDMKNQLKSANEMRVFVDKTLRTYQVKKNQLSNHTTIAEILKELTEEDEFIDELKCQQEMVRGLDVEKTNQLIFAFIAKGLNFYKALRLICINCIVNNGFKQKTLETYKRELIRAYGFKYLALINNIEQIGLLYAQAVKVQKPFSSIVKSYRLIVDDVNEKDPNDVAYVFSGYAPLSVRFCQQILKPNSRKMSDALDLLPGTYFEETQKLPGGLRKRRNSNTSNNSSLSSQIHEQAMSLVFFIGGCTFAEISAFRFLSQSDDNQSDYLIATTNIVNGTSLISSLNESN